MWTLDPFDPTHPARRASAFVDQLLVRARPVTPLVEYLRAHLDAGTPGAARGHAEHLVDLLTLGVRWRLHARAVLRRPSARPDHDAVSGLLLRLRAAGVPAAEVARLGAWNGFALDEGCPEVLDEACDLAAWFEPAADAALGRHTPGVEAQLELVRAEVLSRSLRERRAAAPRSGAPQAAAPRARPATVEPLRAPRPTAAELVAETTRQTLQRLARATRA